MDLEGRRRKEYWKNNCRDRIGKNLRRLRLEAGLTLNELAIQTGNSYTTMRSYEKEGVAPGVDEMLFICKEMGWNFSDLMKKE